MDPGPQPDAAPNALAASLARGGERRADPPRPPRTGLRILVLVGAILLALVLPRALTLPGLTTAGIVEFADMADHLYFLDVVAKQRSLSPEQQQDPFLLAFPETRPRMLAIQWPPGVYWVASLVAPAFGTGSVWTTQIVNISFTLFLLASVVGLGLALGSLRLGLWAALLTALDPALVAATWYFSLDYPMLVAVVAGLVLLVRTQGFARWVPTLLFGLVSAVGTWFKPTYAVYLVGPSMAALVMGLMRGPRRGLVVVRCLVGAALALGLVLVLYQPDWQALGHETRVHFWDRHLPGASTDPFTVEWFLANLKFAVASFPWPLLLLAVPGLIVLHLRPRGPGRILILVYLWAAYLLLTLLANKMERYVQPIYPVLCLLTVFGVLELLPARLHFPSLLALVFAFAGVLVGTHDRPIPWLPEPRDALPMQSAFHPFRYEFHMPSRRQVDRLRAWRHDTECQLQPLMGQIEGLARRHASDQRPLGLIYLRDPARSQVGHPPMAFRRLVPALTLAFQDRYLLVANLHVMEQIPAPLQNVPWLLVLHGPEVNPAAQYPSLSLIEQRREDINCAGERFPFGLSLMRPRQALGDPVLDGPPP